MTTKLRIAVPTATFIVAQLSNATTVALLRSKKHGGKLVFPGGRTIIGEEDFIGCALREAAEEIGVTLNRTTLQSFAMSQKVGRDVRTMTLGKYNEGRALDPDIANIEAEAHFCCDISFFTYVPADTVLKGDGAEGAAFWRDLTTIQPSEFALDHGALAAAWLQWASSATKPYVGQL